jgi:large subunit ribosomal protein L22
MKTQSAKLRYLRITPRKVRLVGDLIKGMSVNEAEARLTLLRKRSAKAMLKLLHSAASNAKNNQKMNPEKLFVKELRVEQGPMLKRVLPRARGTATPIQKKMSHVVLILAENLELTPSKYKVIIPKKVKAKEHDHKHDHERKENKGEEKIKEIEKKKEEIKKEEKKEMPSKKPGFIRRVFSSKSRASK